MTDSKVKSISLSENPDGSISVRKLEETKEPVYVTIGYLGNDDMGNNLFLCYNTLTKVVYLYVEESHQYCIFKSVSGAVFHYDEELDRLIPWSKYMLR